MTDPDELWRGGSAERQARIPAPLRDLHRAILRQFQAYLAARPGIDGEILGQQAAIELGQRIFGLMLR